MHRCTDGQTDYEQKLTCFKGGPIALTKTKVDKHKSQQKQKLTKTTINKTNKDGVYALE